MVQFDAFALERDEIMCRLLGIVASQPVDFGALLVGAARPRSLAALGEEHKDGWGLASYARGRWQVHKGTRAASRDARFRERALGLRGELLVSHVRKRTVGVTRLANSHPFSSGTWVFAHNGTIEDRTWVSARVSPSRAAGIRGDTDSELFFAYVLTRLDAAGLANRPASRETDAVIADVAGECRARSRFGSLNFLLSDGTSCYAHRFGRSLFLLERGGRARKPSIFIASERMTDEGWHEIEDHGLLRIGGGQAPRATRIG